MQNPYEPWPPFGQPPYYNPPVANQFNSNGGNGSSFYRPGGFQGPPMPSGTNAYGMPVAPYAPALPYGVPTAGSIPSGAVVNPFRPTQQSANVAYGPPVTANQYGRPSAFQNSYQSPGSHKKPSVHRAAKAIKGALGGIIRNTLNEVTSHALTGHGSQNNHAGISNASPNYHPWPSASAQSYGHTNRPIQLENVQYSRLTRPREFRLIEFEPVASPQHELSCTIHQFTLDDHPRYIALSYPVSVTEKSRRFRDKEKIKCNGTYFEVSGGMCDILHAVLSKRDPVFIWIDSICIWQDNGEEKQQQIGMMNEIYFNAEETAIWLGTSEDDQERINAGFRALALTHDRCGHIQNTQGLQSNNLAQFSVDEGAAAELLRRVYFSRVFMLQEIALSSKAVVYCASNKLPWRTFAEQVGTILRLGGLEPLLSRFPDVKNGIPSKVWVSRLKVFLFTWIVFERARQGWTSGGEAPKPMLTLKEALYVSRHMDATDPRDRVYAVLGLASDRAAITVNYSKEYSVSMLFYDVALYMMTETAANCQCGKSCCPDNELSFFSVAGVRDWEENGLRNQKREVKSALRSLPSWVPIWIHGGKGSSIGQLWQSSHEARYRAGGDSEPFVWYDPSDSHPKELSIQGIVCDQVGSATTKCSEVGEIGLATGVNHQTRPLQMALALGRWQDECLSLMQQHVPSTHTRMVEFCLTLCANASECETQDLSQIRARKPISDGRALARDFQDFLEFYHALEKQMRGTCPNSVAEKLAFVRLIIQQGALMRYQKGSDAWFDISVRTDVGRKFFVTRNGRMGLGPGLMEAGDVVCVVAGGPTPVILRPSTSAGKYQVVGDCYVHGLMDGQALQMFPNDVDWVCLV